MTIELSEYVIDAIADAIVKKMQEPKFIAKSDGTIEQIKNCDDCIFRKEWEKIGKLLSVILKKQTEQEPCEDAISRQAVLDKIKEVCFSKKQEWVDFRVSQGSNGQRDLIIKFIEDLPSVQPQPKTGYWMKSNIGGAKVCSVCNAHMGLSSFKFCPNCGAKMVESEEVKNERNI